MARNQEEIEASIRNEFPIIFGRADTVDAADYFRKRDAMTEYARSVAGPFLAPETIRYQSILLYVSLTFISLSLFQVGELKIGEALISIDRRFILFYAGFIIVIAAIFLVKAYVDFQRAQFTREKNAHAGRELRELMMVGNQRPTLQQHFWQQISDEIGATYRSYDDALAKVRGREPDSEQRPTSVIKVDLQALRRIPELAAEIDRHQKFRGDLKAKLNDDHTRFRESAKQQLLRPEPPPEEFFSDDRRQNIDAAFDEWLRPWFDARDRLTDENLDHAMDGLSGSLDKRRIDAMLKVFKRTLAILRIYVAFEIVAPVLFALLVVLYVALL